MSKEKLRYGWLDCTQPGLAMIGRQAGRRKRVTTPQRTHRSEATINLAHRSVVQQLRPHRAAIFRKSFLERLASSSSGRPTRCSTPSPPRPRHLVTHFNQDPRPLVWHETADEILDISTLLCSRVAPWRGALANHRHSARLLIRSSRRRYSVPYRDAMIPACGKGGTCERSGATFGKPRNRQRKRNRRPRRNW